MNGTNFTYTILAHYFIYMDILMWFFRNNVWFCFPHVSNLVFSFKSHYFDRYAITFLNTCDFYLSVKSFLLLTWCFLIASCAYSYEYFSFSLRLSIHINKGCFLLLISNPSAKSIRKLGSCPNMSKNGADAVDSCLVLLYA